MNRQTISYLMVLGLLIGISEELIAADSAPAIEMQQVGANQGPVILISRIKSTPGKSAEVVQLIEEFYARVREAEPGNLVNIMHIPSGPPSPEAEMQDPVQDEARSADSDEPEKGPEFSIIGPIADTLVFYEVYKDTAAANAHTATPHFQEFIKKLSPLVEEPISLEFLTELARK